MTYPNSVFVPGTPAPQGSMKAFVVAGRARVVADNKRTHPWRADVAAFLRMTIGPNIAIPNGGVAVHLTFVMPRRAAEPKRVTPAHTRKPDSDKLARAVLDACSGVLFTDDAQVIDLHAIKRTADIAEMPGCHIEWEARP